MVSKGPAHKYVTRLADAMTVGKGGVEVVRLTKRGR